MISRRAKLEATCLDCAGAEVDAFDHTSREITYRTFARHVDVPAIEARLGYGRDIRLRLARDGAVSFHRGRFRGRRCYVLMWSHIHHFFPVGATTGRFPTEEC